MLIRQMLRKARTYGLPLLLSLVVLELVVRWVDPLGVRDLQDQQLLWRTFVRFDQDEVGKTMPPNSKLDLSGWSVQTNQYGFRDDPLPSTKPPSSRRLLFLGDSHLFGHGVAQPRIAAQLLEDSLLARTGQVWEVLNTGLGSYATHEELAIARRCIPALDIDAVALLYSFNDADPRMVRVSPRHQPVIEVPEGAVRPALSPSDGWRDVVRRRPWLHRLVLRSRPRLLDYWAWLRTSRAQSTGGPAELRFDDSNWAWRLSAASLLEIQRLCRTHDLPLLLLYMNDPRLESPSPVALANAEALRELCTQARIPFVDLRGPFVDQELHRHRNSVVDGHADARGQEILAEVFLNALRQEPRMGLR